MAAVATVTPSSNVYTNALLGGYKWASGSLTYGFPVSYTYYESSYGSNEPSRNFEPLNATQQGAVRAAFANFAAVANVTFSELTGASAANATLRLAMSDAPSTAWAYMPSTAAASGDSWYNNASGVYDNPKMGNYAYATFLHEIGHALGLEHPHENAMPASGDAMAFTVMSYRAYEAAPLTGYTNERWGFAQSLMMYDIAALQHLYGANFTTNSGNTTYSWSPTTGQAFVDGVAQVTPGANRIFQTIWDGGGTDTYNFSNYTANLSVDLRPGQWTTTSSAQLARLHYNGGQIADGNIANALQYNGDLRSLIENALGGSGDDSIFGNAADNRLSGRSGADVLHGGAGNDYLDGGDGHDVAIWQGLFAEYRITRGGSGLIYVQDVAVGRDDFDTVAHVERFRFEDRELSLEELFQNALSRQHGFDATFYMLENPDVAASGINPWLHYETFGWKEGRDPNGIFDTTDYLLANKDVFEAGVNPLVHYDLSGWKEGRDPSTDFDTGYYLATNLDVAAANINPLSHYLAHGKEEGRLILPAVFDQKADGGIDRGYYRAVNADVAAAKVDERTHYDVYGWTEGRDPNAYFDTSVYLASNPDVVAAGVNPYKHFLEWGWKEGRSTGTIFEASLYLAANDDVARAGVNPLEHWLNHGIVEGRIVPVDFLI